MTKEELRDWCKKHSFSPDQVAYYLNINRNTFYKWQNGQLLVPNDLPGRLTAVLIARDASTQEPERRKPDLTGLVIGTAQPYGTVVGLQRWFWLEYTDTDRDAWIQAAPNPLLALPWPHWSKGSYEYGEPHYLAETSVSDVKHRMAENEGNIRQAVMVICRRDFPPWMTAKKDKPAPSEAYADLKAAMEKDFQ